MGNCNKKDGTRDFMHDLKNGEDSFKGRTESFAIIDGDVDDDGNANYYIRPKNQAQQDSELFSFEK